MNIKELIKKLKEVEKIEPYSTVWLRTEKGICDFTGFVIVDDVRDVELFAAAGDGEV